ncbi:MAG: patatin family protein [Lachnospiraceae bacterium]|nr:patatin family protein [Robinsoniella sp.]MDY3767404.1 patatin family protein [Lachnospiraceae bacterium]
MRNAAMILEGGANRGIFTGGVLDYLMEQEFYTEYVIGVSAGCCNGLNYVSGQIGRTKECMIRLNSKEERMDLRTMWKKKSLFDMDRLFDTYPNEEIPFDYEAYFKSEMQFELVVTNCETGEAEYLTEREDRQRLMDICRASCSMPLAAPIVEVDEKTYLDGGIADSIPVKRALERGYRKVIVVLTRNQGYRKTISKRTLRCYQVLMRKYPNLAKAMCLRAKHYNKTLEQIEKLEKEGKIFVIRPEMKAIGRIERDEKVLEDFYQNGYDVMKKEYGRLLNYMEEKGEKGERDV